MTNPKPEKVYVTEKFTQLNQDKARLMDAVAAMKKGAHDYLQKPLSIDELRLKLDNLRVARFLNKDVADLREAADVIEHNAAETIQRLEQMVAQLKEANEKAARVLQQDSMALQDRIGQALEALAEA